LTSQVAGHEPFLSSSLPVPILGLGGDGYTDDLSIDAHPDWNRQIGVGLVAELQSFLPTPEAGERWITSGVIGGNPLESIATALPTFEVEASLAVHTSSPALQSRGVMILQFPSGTGGGGFQAININIINTGVVSHSFTVAPITGTDTGPGFSSVLIDTTYYITARYRRQSAINTADGVFELWVNETLVASYTDLDFGAGRAATWTDFIFDARAQNDFWCKNMVAFDTWSTADGVQPGIYDVDDDGSFTESISEVPLSYYYVPPPGLEVADVLMSMGVEPSDKQLEVADVVVSMGVELQENQLEVADVLLSTGVEPDDTQIELVDVLSSIGVEVPVSFYSGPDPILQLSEVRSFVSITDPQYRNSGGTDVPDFTPQISEVRSFVSITDPQYRNAGGTDVPDFTPQISEVRSYISITDPQYRNSGGVDVPDFTTHISEAIANISIVDPQYRNSGGTDVPDFTTHITEVLASVSVEVPESFYGILPPPSTQYLASPSSFII